MLRVWLRKNLGVKVIWTEFITHKCILVKADHTVLNFLFTSCLLGRYPCYHTHDHLSLGHDYCDDTFVEIAYLGGPRFDFPLKQFAMIKFVTPNYCFCPLTHQPMIVFSDCCPKN